MDDEPIEIRTLNNMIRRLNGPHRWKAEDLFRLKQFLLQLEERAIVPEAFELITTVKVGIDKQQRNVVN